MFTIRVSPTPTYARHLHAEGWLVRTADKRSAKTFETPALAAAWWAESCPTLPSVGEGNITCETDGVDWKNVYFVRSDRRLVEVTGLQADDTTEAVVAHARHSARADEHEIEVVYTDDTRERFAVREEDRPRTD